MDAGGSPGRTAFEDALLARVPSCKLHALNASLPEESQHGQVTFHPYGLGPQDEENNRKYALASALGRLQLTDVDILRVDVGHAELALLLQLERQPSSVVALRRVRELHLVFRHGAQPPQESAGAAEALNSGNLDTVFRSLHDHGFALFEKKLYPKDGGGGGGVACYSFLRLAPDFFHDAIGKLARADGLDLGVTFQGIYDHKTWGLGGKGSGDGSTVSYTAKLRSKLVELLVRRNITHLYDAPCGAMAWMPRVLAEMEKRVPGFRYTGYDVACKVIEFEFELN